MKLKVIVLVSLVLFYGKAPICASEKIADLSAPIIYEPVYIFEPVVEGTTVFHDYIISNNGGKTLYLLNVKTT